MRIKKAVSGGKSRGPNTTTLVDGILTEKNISLADKNYVKLYKECGKNISSYMGQLSTRGPQKRISFSTKDENDYFSALSISRKDIASVLKGSSAIKDNFKNLNNEFLILMTILIHHYSKKGTTIGKGSKKTEVSKILVILLVIRAYKIIYSKHFNKFEPNQGVMEYVIDNLDSNRYNIKKMGSVLKVLEEIAETHYASFANVIADPTDGNIAYYITNIISRVSSFVRPLANMYYDAHDKGLTILTERYAAVNSEGEDYLTTIDNLSSTIESRTRNIIDRMTTDRVPNPKLVKKSVQQTKVSYAKFTMALTQIIEACPPEVTKVVRDMISYYLLQNNREDIRSAKFLAELGKAYQVSNTIHPLILSIKDSLNILLNKYSNEYRKTSRVATLSNYKKSLFIYFTLYIINAS